MISTALECSMITTSRPDHHALAEVLRRRVLDGPGKTDRGLRQAMAKRASRRWAHAQTQRGVWFSAWTHAQHAAHHFSRAYEARLHINEGAQADGWFTLQIAKLARHVVAIDIDADLLEVARHRLSESGVTNCDFVVGNAHELTRLWRRPVDFVFLANAFHGVPDRGRLARSVHNALAPTGTFAVVNWHQRPREKTTILGEPRGPKTELRMSPEQTIQVVEGGGF
jgi:SAM-dependent methyltransferase